MKNSSFEVGIENVLCLCRLGRRSPFLTAVGGGVAASMGAVVVREVKLLSTRTSSSFVSAWLGGQILPPACFSSLRTIKTGGTK